MVVKIRLARFGRKNAPFYNIVVTQARTARNSRPMEVLGTYEPYPKKDTYAAAASAAKSASQRALAMTGGKLEWPTPEVAVAAKATAAQAESASTDADAEISTAPKRQQSHKDIQLDVTRAKYWIGVGAQPTETAWRILSYAGILEPKRTSSAAKRAPTQ